MKRINRHRLSRAPPALAADRESELGCQTARRFVVAVLDVRRDRRGTGAGPEIIDCRFHRLGGDAFVPAIRRHPPASLDLAGCDALDAIAGEAQLGAAEEGVVSLVPDGPRPEAVLYPLHVGAASVTRCIGGLPRCTTGLVEACQREKAQSSCQQ